MKLMKIATTLATFMCILSFESLGFSQDKINFNKSETCYFNKDKDAFKDCNTTKGDFKIIIDYKKNSITINEFDVYKIVSHTKTQQQTVIKAIQSTGVPYSIILNGKEGWATFTEDASLKRVKFQNIN